MVCVKNKFSKNCLLYPPVRRYCVRNINQQKAVAKARSISSGPNPSIETAPKGPLKQVKAVVQFPGKIRAELNLEKWPAIWQPSKSESWRRYPKCSRYLLD